MTSIFFKRGCDIVNLKFQIQELIEGEWEGEDRVVFRGEVDGDIRYIEVSNNIEVQDLIDEFVNCYREA